MAGFFADFLAGDFLVADFFVGDFLAGDFLAEDFFVVLRDGLFGFAARFRVLFFAIFLRAGRLVTVRFLAGDFFAALFFRVLAALFLRAGAFLRAAFFAFLRLFFAAIGCLPLRITFARPPARLAAWRVSA